MVASAAALGPSNELRQRSTRSSDPRRAAIEDAWTADGDQVCYSFAGL